eukprot:scaffold37521_cov75-Phaeocystis_antarctica.AAC.5
MGEGPAEVEARRARRPCYGLVEVFDRAGVISAHLARDGAVAQHVRVPAAELECKIEVAP